LAFVRSGSLFFGSLVAVSPLVRPELAVCIPVYLFWVWKVQGVFPLKILALSVIVNGLWILFRIYYYADLLPNTYYLKDVVWWEQGLSYLHNTFGPYYLYQLALLMLAVWYLLYRRGAEFHLPERLVMLAAAVPVALFVVKIGGDARHFRFLAFIFPLLICALAGGILEYVFEYVREEKTRKWGGYLLGAVVGFCSFLAYPPQLDTHPVSDRMSVNPRQVDLINDAAYHRRRRIIRGYAQWREDVESKRLRGWASEHSEGQRMTEVLRGQSCAFNYLNYSTHFVHRAGLTDSMLSRIRVEMERPAHKYALRFFADDIVSLHLSSENMGRGMYRRAVERGEAPPWVVENISSIETIERKMYNNHNFFENLSLAMQFPQPILPQH